MYTLNSILSMSIPSGPMPVVASCSKCGASKLSGKPSCCAFGGSWYGKCGDDGDTNFDHTWTEGVKACKASAQADNCVFGFGHCLDKHKDFGAAEYKLTHEKATGKDVNGDKYGDCLKAILNRVERKLCCTIGMKEITVCVRRHVRDYKACKLTWDVVFGENHYAKVQAVVQAFKPGGFCVSPRGAKNKQITTFPGTSLCPKCGTHKKTGKLNCCAPGGSWHRNCESGDDHSWSEGYSACEPTGVCGVCVSSFGFQD